MIAPNISHSSFQILFGSSVHFWVLQVTIGVECQENSVCKGTTSKEKVFLLLEICKPTMNSPVKHWHVNMVSRWWHTKSSWHLQEIQEKGLTKQASNDLFAKHNDCLLSKPIHPPPFLTVCCCSVIKWSDSGTAEALMGQKKAFLRPLTMR